MLTSPHPDLKPHPQAQTYNLLRSFLGKLVKHYVTFTVPAVSLSCPLPFFLTEILYVTSYLLPLPDSTYRVPRVT